MAARTASGETGTLELSAIASQLTPLAYLCQRGGALRSTEPIQLSLHIRNRLSVNSSASRITRQVVAGLLGPDLLVAQVKDHGDSILQRELDFRAGPGPSGQDDRDVRGQDVDVVAAAQLFPVLPAQGQMRVDGDLDPVVHGPGLIGAQVSRRVLIEWRSCPDDAEDQTFAGLGLVERFAHLRHDSPASSGQEVEAFSCDELSDGCGQGCMARLAASEDAGDLAAPGVTLLEFGFVHRSPHAIGFRRRFNDEVLRMAHLLDLERWPRRATFEYFRGYDKPYFNVCAPLEAGPLVELARGVPGTSFFLAYLYLSLRAANEVEP